MLLDRQQLLILF